MSIAHILLRLVAVISVAMSLVIHNGAAQESTPATTPQPNRAVSFYPEETGPATFVSVELDPGQSETVQIVLGNSGDIDQTLRTYAVPAISATNGGFNLADHGVEPDEATSWLTWEETEFTFAPTEGRSVPLVITVPKEATPGEYVTGLAAEQADTFAVPGSDMLVRRVRWAIPILIVVPGDREPSFELGDATLENRHGTYIAEVGIENTGNVIVRPEGEARLLNADGDTVGVATFGLDSVYRQTSTTFIVVWENVPPSESYTVQVSPTAEEGTVSVEKEFPNLVPISEEGSATPVPDPLTFTRAEFTALTRDTPPSVLQLDAEISNAGEPIADARISIVTYKDGVEVDRNPIMQAVTLETGTTPVQARYSLPGGFTKGTYTFEVTIELGNIGTQTVLVTQELEFQITVP